MMNSLENEKFFSSEELDTLRSLGIYEGHGISATRSAFAMLMLSPILDLSQIDRVATPTEFEVVEEYIQSIEQDFELAPKEAMEEVGTDMGMLPMLQGNWKRSDFKAARALLASSIERLSDAEAHKVRSAIAKACLRVAQAGQSGIISLHTVNGEDIPLIQKIARELKLETTAEGLNLLGKSGA